MLVNLDKFLPQGYAVNWDKVIAMRACSDNATQINIGYNEVPLVIYAPYKEVYEYIQEQLRDEHSTQLLRIAEMDYAR